MASKIHDEQMKFDIIINGNNAQKKLGDLQQAKRDLKRENDNLRKAKAQLVAEGKKETEEYKRLTSQISTNNQKLKQNQSEHKQLVKEIGVAGLTTRQLRAEQKRLKAELGGFTKGSDQYNKLALELGAVEKQMRDVRKETDAIKKTLDDDQSFSTFGEAFAKIKDGVNSGDLKSVGAGFKVVSKGIKTATKSALAFIATPLGATIAGIAAIIGVGKMWYQYNVEIAKTLQLTEQLTGLQGQQLSDHRAQVQAVADTFDQDYNEVLRASNALAKQMGISQTEALKLVEQGFVRGANANGDFLDKVREYPVQFKNAGYSAQDFIDVATQEVKGGVFNDKLVDTIKEIDLSLREMDNAQIEVLETNFGKKYAKELIDGIAKGEITTKQAFENIIKKSNKMGLNIKQQQKIVADIMKSAGEDAGGFVMVIEQLNEAFKEENKTLDENEQATQRLVVANKEQEEALADLFDASKSGFPAMLTNLKALGKEIFTNTLRGFHRLITSQEQLNETAGLQGQSKAIKDISENMKTFGSTAKQEVDAQIDTALKNIDRVKSKLDNLNFFQKTFGTKSTYEEKLAEYKAYYNELLKIKKGASNKFNEYQDDLKEIDTPKVINKKSDKSSFEKSAKQRAFKKAEESLNEFIKQKQSERLLNQKAGLEKEIAQITSSYKAKIDLADKHSIDNKELIALRDKEIADAKLVKQQEYLELANQIEKENKEAKQQALLEEAELMAVQDEEKALALIERAKTIADTELEIELTKELAKVEAVENAELLKDAIRNKYLLKQQKSDNGFAKAKIALKKDEVKWTDMSEKEKFGLVRAGLNQSAEAFNKGSDAWKAIKVTETMMATYEGAQAAFNSFAKIPIVGVPMGIAAATAATFAGIQRVNKIASTKAEKMPGFEDGLYPVTRTDGKRFNAKLGTTKTGLVSMPTLMDGKYLAGERSTARNPEMIIDDVTFSKLDPKVISYILNVHNGTVSGYETGKYNTSSKEAVKFENETSTLETSSRVEELLLRIAEATESGKDVRLIFGYEDAEKVAELQKELNDSKQNGRFGS